MPERFARAFDCRECRRHVYVFGGPDPDGLCLSCTHIPGWFRDPVLRRAIDPGHDGSDPAEPRPEEMSDAG